jgi:hypothetical protein
MAVVEDQAGGRDEEAGEASAGEDMLTLSVTPTF